MFEAFFAVLNTLIGWDTDVMLAINSFHSAFWDEFMWLSSGKWIWAMMYASILYVLIRELPARVVLACVLAMVLVIVLSDQTVSTLIRPFVGRLRPANLMNAISPMVHVVDGYRGGAFSFPSAHAANAAGFTMFMILLFRRRLLSWFFVFWTLLLCYSRIYLGVHYPGDLLVGILIGSLYGWLCYRLFCAVAGRLDYAVASHEMHSKTVLLPLWVGLLTLAAITMSSIFVIY